MIKHILLCISTKNFTIVYVFVLRILRLPISIFNKMNADNAILDISIYYCLETLRFKYCISLCAQTTYVMWCCQLIMHNIIKHRQSQSIKLTQCRSCFTLQAIGLVFGVKWLLTMELIDKA